MAHPLQQTIRSIGRRARRLVTISGVCSVLAAVVAVLVVLGLVDYLVRIQDTGVRIICTGLLAFTLIAALIRFLVRPLRHRWRDVEVAQRVERRFPQLDDRLSSAVSFLEQSIDDPTAGSLAMRRAVITEAENSIRELPLASVLDPRPARRAAWVATAVSLLAAGLVVADPTSARIAVARLTNPLGEVAWPKQHQLRFKQSLQQLASGQPFEVELVDDGGALPESVQIHYRYEVDGVQNTESEQMQLAAGVMLARKDHVTRPFEYRATGGDDDSMEWIPLAVVEPPLVERFEVTLHPPAYTGIPAAPAEKRIRALRGTRITIVGAATKPLSAAYLNLDSGQRYPAKISQDGYAFTVDIPELLVDKSGEYWFTLVDGEGLEGGADSRWEIRAVVDSPPSVSIEEPSGSIFVTPEAAVPIKVLAKDNLGVRDVQLRYLRPGSDKTPLSLPLYEGPTQAPRQTGTSGELEQGESRLVEHTWRLAELGLKPGDQLSVAAEASDYLPQTGESAAARRITIISAAELEDRLAERQGLILGELARALKMQRETRTQTTAAEIQLREVGRLAQGDLDSLQAAELNQRQVARTLTSPTEGVVGQIQNLLDDLASNKVDSPELHRRMQSFLDVLQRLDKEPLPVVQRELTAALKAAQTELADPKPSSASNARIAPSLADAGAAQDEVIGSLEQLLGELSEWTDYRRFARDVRQLHRDQQQLGEQTAEAGAKTVGGSPGKQELAELKKLAQRQQELSRSLDRVLEGMQQMQGELDEKDPLAASTLEDALHQARQEAVSGRMRDAATALEQNRIGEATQEQAKVAAQLNELLDILSNRREHELNRLVKKLREAEDELDALRQQQSGLRKKLDEAAAAPKSEEQQRQLARLQREQEQVKEAVERMARRLQRLQAERAGKTAQRAAAKLGQGAEAAGQGDAAGAGEQSAQAEQDLEQAQAEVAKARKQAEADLAQEMLAQLDDAIRAMLVREQRMLEETVRLDGLKKDGGELDRVRQNSLQTLAREQRLLEEETTSQAAKLGKGSVTELAFDGIARPMRRAAQLLTRGETGQPSQAAEREALARLTQLLKAFANDDEKSQQGKAGGDGQGGGDQPGQEGQNQVDVAELKLLRLLQEDVFRRTRELEQAIAEGTERNEDQLREFDELRTEQGRLADIVLELGQPVAAEDEIDPEKLPDIRPDQDKAQVDGEADGGEADDKILPGANPADAEGTPPSPVDDSPSNLPELDLPELELESP